MKKAMPFLWCIGIGLLSLFFSYKLFVFVSAPDLLLDLIPSGENEGRRLAIRFTNVGNRDLYLDVDGMEYFLFIPDNFKQHYLIHIRSVSVPGSLRAMMSRRMLRPGEALDIGNMYPLLKERSADRGTLSAQYSVPVRSGDHSDWWRGTVKSGLIELGTQ